MIFNERHDAGRQLATELKKYPWKPDTLVLGLARGGVVVAHEVAKALHLKLDVVVPRKVPAPHNPELAIGAIMEDGQSYFDEGIIELTEASPAYIEQAIEREKREAQRRILLYRGSPKPLEIRGKTVILVDDGIATGSTMIAVVRSMKAAKAERVVVAVPVASMESIQMLRLEADQVISLSIPHYFGAVGNFYRLFDQTEDREVIELLK
jgi:putative phosphoribosyl transferase